VECEWIFIVFHEERVKGIYRNTKAETPEECMHLKIKYILRESDMKAGIGFNWLSIGDLL
jgi:hypothetical protein